MHKIVENLSKQFIYDLSTADEIWIAVALMKSDTLKEILKSIKNNCEQNYLVGYNLPTDPDTFKMLYNLTKKDNIKAKCIRVSNNFHPKLYMIKAKESHITYIGSANCTKGGFVDNIEMNIRIDDNNTFNELLKWFDNIFRNAKEIDKPFLSDYRKYYKKRKDNEKKKDKLLKDLEKQIRKSEIEIEKKNKMILLNREKFIEELINYRNDDKIYNEDIKERIKAVEDIRKTLDYPNFINPDIDGFFKIPHLGRLLDFKNKERIKANYESFKKLLSFLCDDKIPVYERIDKALNEMKVPGVSDNIITKILTVHDPNNYFVFNTKFLKTFNIYNPDFQRGLSFGKKYSEILKVLKEIKHESNIKDFSVLDCFIYRKGDIIKKKMKNRFK